jgi:hypothetical protein
MIIKPIAWHNVKLLYSLAIKLNKTSSDNYRMNESKIVQQYYNYFYPKGLMYMRNTVSAELIYYRRFRPRTHISCHLTSKVSWNLDKPIRTLGLWKVSIRRPFELNVELNFPHKEGSTFYKVSGYRDKWAKHFITPSFCYDLQWLDGTPSSHCRIGQFEYN